MSFIEKSGWCNLCREPYSSWTLHNTGLREHASLQVVYTAIEKDLCRTWTPSAVLRGFEQQHHHHLKAIHAYQHAHHDSCPTQRIYHVLHHLHHKHNKLLSTNCHRPSLTQYTFGKNQLRYRVCRIVVSMFPDHDSGDLTAIHQTTINARNLENVFDVLHLNKLYGGGGGGLSTD
eukprot:PhF_6_TR5177/c2_g2_i4/m.7433